MSIIKHELIKIITFPALVGFVVLALALNIVVVVTMQDSYADFIAEASRTTGVNLGAEFDGRVAALEPSLYADLLRVQTEGMIDVLDGYTTGYIADSTVERLGLSGLSERLMRSKYEHFQYAVDARQTAGDSMTLYFAEATFWRHEALFDITMGLLLFQGIILAALVMLLSLGFENTAKTDLTVYSTKVGRKINRHKLIAGIIVGVGVYALLAAVTLSLYFAFNPMGGTWGSSVSSGFNFIRDGLITRPFVTWHGFTVTQYLFASIGVSFALVLCFALMAYAVGLWLKNSYVGFLVIIALNSALYIMPFYSNLWMLNFTVTQSPIWLVLLRAVWFTDGTSSVLWPHFEMVGVISSLTVLAIIGVWSAAKFKRRNLV